MANLVAPGEHLRAHVGNTDCRRVLRPSHRPSRADRRYDTTPGAHPHHRRQLRLPAPGATVCPDDFPSWAEQPRRGAPDRLADLPATPPKPNARARPGISRADHCDRCGRRSPNTSQTQAAQGLDVQVQSAPVWGNRNRAARYKESGGALVGTKGLWAGVSVAEPDRTQVVWINKLPFPPFADPFIAPPAEPTSQPAPPGRAADARRTPTSTTTCRSPRSTSAKPSDGCAARQPRRDHCHLRPETGRHDTLAAHVPPSRSAHRTRPPRQQRDRRRRRKRDVDGARLDPDLGVPRSTRANLHTSALSELCSADACRGPTRCCPLRGRIAENELTPAEESAMRADGTLEQVVLDRCELVAGALRFSQQPVALKLQQREAIAATVRGDDLCAVLPTGFGHSWCFQLPALVLPGLTIVVSPLVALMTDQVLDLNPVLGDRVRALGVDDVRVDVTCRACRTRRRIDRRRATWIKVSRTSPRNVSRRQASGRGSG